MDSAIHFNEILSRDYVAMGLKIRITYLGRFLVWLEVIFLMLSEIYMWYNIPTPNMGLGIKIKSTHTFDS